VDVNEASLAESADLVRAHGRNVSVHLADVSDRARMQHLPGEVLAEHGHVHILVNNAGVSVIGTLLEQSLDDFEWLMGINFWGVVYGCKLFLPFLLAEDEAQIVNISSMFGFIGIPTQISYNASKYAVRGFSEALSSELSGTQVGVTCVHPGGIRTNVVRASAAAARRGRRRGRAFGARSAATTRVRSAEAIHRLAQASCLVSVRGLHRLALARGDSQSLIGSETRPRSTIPGFSGRCRAEPCSGSER
jgi:short-subunit dehydrogenase